MILLTGATGFFGMNATQDLLARGKKVLATDLANFPEMKEDAFTPEEKNRLAFSRCDITSKEEVTELFENHKIEQVIHAAAATVLMDEDEEKPRTVFDVNAGGTFNLLEAAKEFNISRFVYVSSSGVYGSAGKGVIPVHETTPYQPSGLYIAAKIYSELMCRRFSDFSPFTAKVARIGSPYGPWERPTGTRKNMSPIYKLVHMGFEKVKAKIFGADTVRDWTHMKDIARGVVDIALEPEDSLNHFTYNITNGENVSMGYVARKLEKLVTDFEYELVEDPGKANINTKLSNPRGPLDITRLTKDCSFEPEYNIDKGLSNYIDWIKKLE